MGKRGTILSSSWGTYMYNVHTHVYTCMYNNIIVYSCSTQPGWHGACMCECCPGCVLQLFLSDVPKQKTCMQ